MLIDVRLFAMLRERAGSDSVTVEVPDGATARDAVEAVALTHGLGDLISRMSVVMAVNREYADDDSVLAEGDELALIPPVSGGAAVDVSERFASGEGYGQFMELVGRHAPAYFTPTLELKVNFLRPARPGRLVCDGRVVHMGKSVAFLEGSLADDEGNVVATATATARVVRLGDKQ